jgi:molecular chaperone GrpE (heat shock protein)
MPPVKKRAAKKSSAKKRTSAKKRSAAKKSTGSTASKKATAATSAPMTPKSVEDVAERIRDLNEQIIERGRTAGLAYLDAYERALATMSDYQRRMASAAEGGRTDWLATLLKAQADFMRDTGETVSAYVRKSLR